MTTLPNVAALKAFLAVARSQSFTEASRVLHISQPALSRTIRLLEEDLGVRLFDRDTRNVVLTPAGLALQPVVERLIADFEQAFSELHQTFSGQRGRIVVGSLPSIAAGILPRLIADFQKAMPRVDVQIRDALAGALEQMLEDRQIDLALIAVDRPPAQLSFSALGEETFGLVCQAGGELDMDGPASWSVFTDHPFIAMARSSSVRIATDAALTRAGLSPTQLYQCAHVTTVGGLVRAGLGVSACPPSTMALMGQTGLCWRPLIDPAVNRTLGLARAPGRTLPPAAAAFERYVIEHFSQCAIDADFG